MTVITFGGRPVINSETITVDATVGGKALTSTKYRTVYQAATNDDLGQVMRTANSAWITVEGNPIRYSIDPAVVVDATSNGHVAAAGATIILEGTSQIVNFRAIRTTGSSGTIFVTYFG